jgi:hypothetical protein
MTSCLVFQWLWYNRRVTFVGRLCLIVRYICRIRYIRHICHVCYILPINNGWDRVRIVLDRHYFCIVCSWRVWIWVWFLHCFISGWRSWKVTARYKIADKTYTLEQRVGVAMKAHEHVRVWKTLRGCLPEFY